MRIAACVSWNDVMYRFKNYVCIKWYYIYNIRYIAWYMFRWFSPGFAAVKSHQATNPPSEATASWAWNMGVLWGVGPSTFHHMPRIDPKDKLQVHNAKWHSSKSAKKSCGSSHLIGIVYHCLSQFSSPPIPSPNCGAIQSLEIVQWYWCHSTPLTWMEISWRFMGFFLQPRTCYSDSCIPGRFLEH